MILAKACPGRNRILVIEDDGMQAQILAEGLTGAGFAVDVVSSGLAALEKIETKDYDAVLVDYSIPEIDGLAVARVVGDVLGPVARPVLIALTSSPERVTIRESGSKSAFDLILEKSCGLRNIIFSINHCIASAPLAKTRRTARDAIYQQVEDEFFAGPRSLSEDREELNILVVEDNKLQQSLLTYILKHRGYAVEVASDGLQAIRSIRAHHFDLAIIDYKVPEMDGAAVASLVLDRISEAYRPRLIGYTASPDLLRDRTALAGSVFDEIVDKSSNIDELLSTITRLLQSSPNATTRRLASVGV
jgi:two-component system sensor histidine kinase/response regulator